MTYFEHRDSGDSPPPDPSKISCQKRTCFKKRWASYQWNTLKPCHETILFWGVQLINSVLLCSLVLYIDPTCKKKQISPKITKESIHQLHHHVLEGFYIGIRSHVQPSSHPFIDGWLVVLTILKNMSSSIGSGLFHPKKMMENKKIIQPCLKPPTSHPFIDGFSMKSTHPSMDWFKGKFTGKPHI